MPLLSSPDRGSRSNRLFTSVPVRETILALERVPYEDDLEAFEGIE